MRKRSLGWFGPLASGMLAVAALALGHSRSCVARDVDTPDDSSVMILNGVKSGELAVKAQGAGDSRVKFTIENKSRKRLRIVIPPGLVAASTAGQGFQSMGLGVPTANAGSFGAFRTGRDKEAGFRSIPADAPASEGLALSPGQTIEVSVPSVCLNFGLPTPTAKNVFKLTDVETYTPDQRVRRALKSLATLGTSHGVAQAAMWNICNGLSFDQLAKQNVSSINAHELAQAARFVQAVDASSGDLVEASYFQQGRIVIRIQGEGLTAKDARRIAGELEGVRTVGLPLQVIDNLDGLEPRPGTMLLNIMIQSSKPAQTACRVGVRVASAQGEWQPLGQFEIKPKAAVSELKGEAFATEIGQGLARSFITVAPARHSPGITTFKVTNRLPLTIAHLSLKAGKAGDAVQIDGLGIGPARSAMIPVQAGSVVVGSVELNGL